MTRTLLTAIFLTLFSQTVIAEEVTLRCESITTIMHLKPIKRKNTFSVNGSHFDFIIKENQQAISPLFWVDAPNCRENLAAKFSKYEITAQCGSYHINLDRVDGSISVYLYGNQIESLNDVGKRVLMTSLVGRECSKLNKKF